MTTIVNFDRAALLHKPDVTYGVDPTPDGTNDAMLISNGRIRFQANKLSRELSQAYLGASPFVLTGRQAFIEFDFELIGNGTAGLAAPHAALLLSCGHAETLVAITSATYNPVSTSFGSGASYFYVPGGNASGATQHIVLGMRGSIVFSMQVNGYTKGRAVLQGKEAALSDVAFPSQTLSAFQNPVAISESNWAVNVNGFAVDCVEFSLDQGNRVQMYETSEQQSIAITGRDTTGFVRIMDPALSSLDAWALSAAGTQVVIDAMVTGGAGKNTKINVPTAQLDYPERIDIDGASGLRIPFSAIPTSAGNDEYDIVFT